MLSCRGDLLSGTKVLHGTPLPKASSLLTGLDTETCCGQVHRPSGRRRLQPTNPNIFLLCFPSLSDNLNHTQARTAINIYHSNCLRECLPRHWNRIFALNFVGKLSYPFPPFWRFAETMSLGQFFVFLSVMSSPVDCQSSTSSSSDLAHHH